MKIVHVVGARPNYMKIAPVMKAVARAGFAEQRLVHTGQHYDERMSDVFFEDLSLPAPDFHLGVGSGSHAEQTAKIMLAFEKTLARLPRPDWVVVPGDVNSTLAAALVAAKLGLRVAHLEAGLRSRDRRMPEELNRIATDHLSDLLLTPSADADENLSREGIAADRIVLVGNTMIDSLLAALPLARERAVPEQLGLEDGGQGRVGGMAGLDVEEGQLGIDDDRAQDVVEIVGDASGQGPQGVHLLGLAELPLEGILLGDVLFGDQAAEEGSGRILDG